MEDIIKARMDKAIKAFEVRFYDVSSGHVNIEEHNLIALNMYLLDPNNKIKHVDIYYEE